MLMNSLFFFSHRNVMKCPQTDSGKKSLPGVLEVRRVNGIPTVFPKNDSTSTADNLLKVVYDKKPVPGAWEDFTTVRNRVQEQWAALPLKADTLSAEIKQKMADTFADQKERNAKALGELSERQ